MSLASYRSEISARIDVRTVKEKFKFHGPQDTDALAVKVCFTGAKMSRKERSNVPLVDHQDPQIDKAA